MMGESELREATKTAVLSANYIAKKLKPYYPILFSDEKGLVAHECILDINQITSETNISNEDISKYKPLVKLYDRADIINDIA